LIREDDLIRCVLAILQAYINHIASLDTLLDSISEEQENQKLIAEYKSQIADNQVKLDKALQYKATLYENYLSGFMDKSDYRDLKKMYSQRAEQAQEAIQMLREKMERAADNTSERLRWTHHFKQFATMTELDRRAVITMIQSIKVLGKDDLEVTYRYELEYAQARQKLEQHGKQLPSLPVSVGMSDRKEVV